MSNKLCVSYRNKYRGEALIPEAQSQQDASMWGWDEQVGVGLWVGWMYVCTTGHLRVKDQFVSHISFPEYSPQKGMMQCGAQELASPCCLPPKGTVFALNW